MMKIALFSARPYDREFLEPLALKQGFQICFFESPLNKETTDLAKGFDVVCVFVNDELDETVIRQLKALKIGLIALRCAGFNNVDLAAAKSAGISVVRVPAYSPHAVAEYTFALILAVNRKLHRAYNRVREGNFSLNGLMGFDLHGKRLGIVGTGKIGAEVAKIGAGFGCQLLFYDPRPNPELAHLGEYTDWKTLLGLSHIITLHCPLTKETKHLINQTAIEQMIDHVMLINTGRGALIDTVAVIQGLKRGKIGAIAIDVYEEEAGLFFEDRSDRVMQDDVFTRLLTFPNVLVTGHQAFFTREAMSQIAETTLQNIVQFSRREPLANEVTC